MLENTITIDASQFPKQIGLTNTKTNETWLGIYYELDRDQFKAVFQREKDRERPAALKTKMGSGEVMYIFQRVTP